MMEKKLASILSKNLTEDELEDLPHIDWEKVQNNAIDLQLGRIKNKKIDEIIFDIQTFLNQNTGNFKAIVFLGQSKSDTNGDSRIIRCKGNHRLIADLFTELVRKNEDFLELLMDELTELEV